MVDAVNENVKEEDDEEEDEEDETEDGSMFEAMFDSEQENRQPVTNIRCVCLNIHCPVYLMSINVKPSLCAKYFWFGFWKNTFFHLL